MKKQFLEMIFEVSSLILGDNKDSDIDIIPETGCNVFDNASCLQKCCLIINSIASLFDDPDTSTLIEAGLAAILEYLAMLIDEEHDEDSSFYFRKMAYFAWSARNRKTVRQELRQWRKVHPEMGITEEELFLEQRFKLENCEFWRDYVVEDFFYVFGIDDRDYQLTSIFPELIEGGDEVKALIGFCGKCSDLSIPPFDEAASKILFDKFNSLKQEFENGTLQIKLRQS